MSEVRALLASLREKRRADDTKFAAITADQLALPTTFTWETMMTGGDGRTTGACVRDIFLRRADHLEEHQLEIEGMLRNECGIRSSPAQMIWAATQRVRGSLDAALVGLTDDDLDVRSDRFGDTWSLRQMLEHILVVDRYYTMDARHALKRFRAGEPHGDLPDDELEIERPGASLRQLLDELDTAREDALTDLLAIGDAELRAPSSWNDIEIDVRFLLMRFAHHEREHIDQILKWRVACNRPASEAERLLGRVWEQSGALEGLLIAVSDDVLDHKIDGHWTIRRILAHIRSAENYFRRLILRAVETPAKPVAV